MSPSTSDPTLGSGGRALLALLAEADRPQVTTPQPPGGPDGPASSDVDAFGSAPAENRAGRGLVVAALGAGLMAIAVVVGIVVVLTGSRDKTPVAASAFPTVPSGEAAESPVADPSSASGDVGWSDAVFAPGGFTFEQAPASAMSEVRQGFEAGMRSSLTVPGLTVEEILEDVSGRSVGRDGEQVALALAMKLHDQWEDQIDSSDLLAGAKSRLDSFEEVTVAGTDAIYAEIAGTGQLMAYKDGTFLMIMADSADRETLEEVMAGLIANLG